MSDEVRYDEAMHHAYAGKQYGCMGSTYEGITWRNRRAKAHGEQLEAIWDEISADYKATQVGFARKTAYPTIEELTVALWEKMVETDGLSSDAITAIQAKRAQVKSDNPKD